MTSLTGPYGRWRKRARRFAQRNGFFWLPCELCGEEFGGHEPHGSIQVTDHSGRSICPFCTAERQQAAERRLAELGESTFSGPLASSTGRKGPCHRLPFTPDAHDSAALR